MPGSTARTSTARRGGTKAKSPAKVGKKAARPAAKKRTTKPAVKKAKPSAKKAVRKPAKKAAPRKAAPKKAAPKKAAPKKAVPKKPAPAKVVKKVAPTKGTAATKAAPAKKPVAAAAKAAAAPARPAKDLKKKTVTCELSGFEVMPSVPNLSTKTVDRLRQKLLEEKERLLHQAADLAAEAEQLAREREAGDTQFDEESGEGDTVNIERERDLLLSASARQVVDEIDEALARIKKGTYGVCKYAGRKIPLERLEAIPWANVCVDCKARAERRR
jgi:RNA polymerase-binding protein DksA